MDDASSRQNGYSQNKHLKEAHKVLDNNLGTKKSCLVLFLEHDYSNTYTVRVQLK